MTELGTALRELTRDARSPSPADPVDLWRRGRTRVRRRRAALVALAALVAVAGSLLVVRPEPRIVMPAGRTHAPAIPMNVYQPNRFLARISDTGPPGRLAMIAKGDHGWFGISATNGRYTALDLPRLATEAPVALSPDGTKVAYGVTGPTLKKDFGRGDEANSGGPLPERPMVGVAVYDLRTGDVAKQVRKTDYGFSIFSEAPLAWLGENRIEYAWDVAVGSNTSKPAGAYVWDLDEGEPRRLRGENLEQTTFGPTTDPSRFVRVYATDVALTDDHGVPTGDRIRIKGWDGGGPSSISLSPGFVVLAGPYGKGNQQVVSAAARPSGASFSVQLVPIGRIVAPQFLGWNSRSSVLVTGQIGVLDGDFLGLPGGGLGDETVHLYEVDLQTRKVHELGHVDGGIGFVQVARSLLDEPLVHGRKPPSLLDAFHLPLGIGAVVLVGAGVAFVLNRRRRRG